MGKSIMKWVADDGTEFHDQRSMILYELEIVDKKEISLFLDTIYECGPKRKGEYTKLLQAWQKYIRELGTENIEQAAEFHNPYGGNDFDLDAIYEQQEAQAKDDPPLPSGLLEEEEESDDWIMKGAQKI